MRPRTFILIIAVLLVFALAVVLVIANNSDGGLFARLSGGQAATEETGQPLNGTVSEDGQGGEEPGIPAPEPTAAPGFQRVVVTTIDIPIGTRITEDLVEVIKRPDTNIALQGGYTIESPEEVIGKIARFDIAKGQEILRDMLAINSTDMGDLGSDLALYVDQGEVAIAFPINQLSGLAFAMRPGDKVDLLMTLRLVAIDPEFRTALPNFVQRVIEPELREGGQFLIEDVTPQGRLEFIEEVGQVAEIIPSSIYIEGQDFEPGSPIPKRVTQLTIQQADVLWVGTWKSQEEILAAEAAEAPQTSPDLAATAAESEAETTEEQMADANCISVFTGAVIPCPVIRRATTPDVVILGMTSQDALALKYALERGIDIDLALRSQGDESNFVTASVSLPQIIEQGGLAVPPPADFDLHPRPEDVDVPFLPARPPED
jgi:Flp pilus assembly protein CpaB